jgi:hypothetical protein
VQGRLALGPRAGARVERLGHDPDAPWIKSSQPLQARCDGFDLHAGVTVAGEDRRRLEQLCRYLLRPPIAQERLTLRPDGTVVVMLKRSWRDGTTHLRFEPLTLLERLAALTPRPRINVLIYHGLLAPHAAGRAAAVAYGRPASPGQPHVHEPVAGPAAEAVSTSTARPGGAECEGVAPGPAVAPSAPVAPAPGAAEVTPQPEDHAPTDVRPRRWRWAELLQRVFAVDVLACPRCGGRMRVLATIDDPRVVRRILTHLGLAGDAGPPAGPPSRRAA